MASSLKLRHFSKCQMAIFVRLEADLRNINGTLTSKSGTWLVLLTYNLVCDRNKMRKTEREGSSEINHWLNLNK